MNFLNHTFLMLALLSSELYGQIGIKDHREITTAGGLKYLSAKISGEFRDSTAPLPRAHKMSTVYSDNFISLGWPQGAVSYGLTDISEDGSVAVGQVMYSDSGEAFRWTISSGFTGLGDLPGGGFGSIAMAVSGDGNIVVGQGLISHSSGSAPEPFRWTQAGGMQGLGYLSDTTAEAYARDISSDGTTIVGKDSTGWKWSGGSMSRLASGGPRTFPNGVSADGSVIVGSVANRAFRWTAGGGLVTIIGPNSNALAVSADGNTVVGESAYVAFRWTQSTGMVSLGTLPGLTFSRATGVSADGSIVVGSSCCGITAFIWKEEWGHMVSMRDYLEDSVGLVLPSWNLIGNLTRISDNGKVIASTGEEGGWIVHLAELSIRSPGSTDLWIAGEQDTIRWNHFRADTVNIFYSTDYDTAAKAGRFDTVVTNYGSNTIDSGYYVWEIPDTILSKKCVIRIVSKQDSLLADTSDLFKIKGYILTRDSSDQYEPFRFAEDRWSFGNDAASMWPPGWWSQFDYYNGIDPNTGYQYPSDTTKPFWRARPQDFPDWPVFVRAFETDQCYWNTTLGIYKQKALDLWKAKKEDWGGSCFGFAISSLLAFDDSSGFRRGYPEVPPYSDLFSVALDTSTRRVVNELYVHQFGQPHKFITNLNANTRTPTQTIRDLKAILLNDAPDPPRLAIRNNGPDGGGHAITPYKVWHDTTNEQYYWIHVYDNSNHNDLNARIRVDTSVNGGNGSWDFDLWPGWGGDKWLYLGDPVSNYLSRPVIPEPSEAMIAAVAGVEMYPSIRGDVLIRNPAGETIGFVDSMVINSMPDAHPFIPETGSKTPPYSYTLPEGAYAVTLDSFTDSTTQLVVFTDSTVFSYQRSDVTPTQTDRVSYDNNLSIRNTDPQAKKLYLSMLIVEDTTAEKLYGLTGITVAQNDSLRLARMNHDDLKLSNVGTQKAYNLHLDYASATASPRFRAFGITLEANSSHLVVPDWTDLQQLVPIYIDLNNNGTIDDTVYINNTVSVDDQGSLFVPKEYNLAQNYPNPFNPYTNIRYALPHESHVKLTIYTILGQEVATLVDEQQVAGHHAVRWEGNNSSGTRVGSGVYFYRLEARATSGGVSYISTKKMLILK